MFILHTFVSRCGSASQAKNGSFKLSPDLRQSDFAHFCSERCEARLQAKDDRAKPLVFLCWRLAHAVRRYRKRAYRCQRSRARTSPAPARAGKPYRNSNGANTGSVGANISHSAYSHGLCGPPRCKDCRRNATRRCEHRDIPPTRRPDQLGCCHRGLVEVTYGKIIASIIGRSVALGWKSGMDKNQKFASVSLAPKFAQFRRI